SNGSGAVDTNLTSYNDWANIQFRVGAIGGLGASLLPMLSDPEPVLNWDLTPPVTTAQPVPGPNGYGWNRVSVTVTLHPRITPGASGSATSPIAHPVRSR